MSLAVTFCDQTEHERPKNEHGYSSFHRSEAESLPHVIEFEIPLPFQFTTVPESIHSLILVPWPNQNRAIMSPDVRIVKPRF